MNVLPRKTSLELRLRRNGCILTTLGLLLLVRAGQHATAEILVEDDFEDGIFDTTKWEAIKNVQEVNGRLELENAGAFRTALQFDPLVVGPIVVTGEYINLAGSFEDILAVYSRSDGAPSGTGSSTEGILANFVVGGAAFTSTGAAIFELTPAGNQLATVTPPVGAGIGDVISFRYEDDGWNIRWQVFGPSGDLLTDLTAQSSLDFATDFIAFHNREFGDNRAAYDNIRIETVETDPLPLTVRGTTDADDISVTDTGTQIEVEVNGSVTLYDINSVSFVEVFGQDGDDTITHLGDTSVPVIFYGGLGDDLLVGNAADETFFGGLGNDTLKGGAGNDWLDCGRGNDIAIGGAGEDTLEGGNDSDLLIGGIDADIVHGSKHDDLLVGASTTVDCDVAALWSLLDEWTSGNKYRERVDNLLNGSGTPGGGLNGTIFLTDVVVDDAAVDVLEGGVKRDYFYGDRAEIVDLETEPRKELWNN